MTTTTQTKPIAPRRWWTRLAYVGLVAAPLAPFALDLISAVAS